MAIANKMFEKHLWKSDILSTLFHMCFSHILLVKTNYLVTP